MTNKTEAVLVKEGKNEFLYLKNVPVFFAKVLELTNNFNKDGKEFQFTVFVDKETRDKLELPVDEGGIAINKILREVGKDRNKLKRIKYPLQSQLKDGKGTGYDIVEGMFGMGLSLSEFTKQGKKSILKVVDSNGKDWDKSKAIGNGSKIDVKFFGYRNQDDQLVVFPNLIVVTEHVPYEGGNGGTVTDDVLGVTVDMSTSYEEAEDTQAESTPTPADTTQNNEDDLDEVWG